MLIEYVKTKRGKLIGVVAAEAVNCVGWSKFNYSKENGKFNKQKAVEIATGRARKLAETGVVCDNPPMNALMRNAIVRMNERIYRYIGKDE